MNDINQVCEILNLTNKQMKNIIDPSRNHRAILDRLGCKLVNNKYLFSDEAIKYIAYQYMGKNDECFYYVYPNMKSVILNEIQNYTTKDIKKPAAKKVLKRVKR